MKYYTGNEPCHGCGKTGKEVKRLYKNSLCNQCKEDIYLGSKIRINSKPENDIFLNVNVYLNNLKQIGNLTEHRNTIASFIDFLKSISNIEKGENTSSFFIGNHMHGCEHNHVRNIILKSDTAEKLQIFITSLNQYSEELYKYGLKTGSNLLLQLNENEISPDTFLKRINNDNTF